VLKKGDWLRGMERGIENRMTLREVAMESEGWTIL
jgi:hypothetical protein